MKQDRFSDPLQEAILNVLVAAGHIREKLERTCVPFGVTLAQYNVLRILRGVYPGGHPRCEISCRMVERAPDVTRLIDRLEKRGLVERDRSATDRRLSITRITKKGLDLLDQMAPDQEFQKQYEDRISLKDRRELSRILESLYAQEDAC